MRQHAGVVRALFSQVVTCRLAEPAGTGRRGEGGPVLMPLHSRGPRCRGRDAARCRGLRCRLLRRGHGAGEFLAADPDSGDRDEQGEPWFDSTRAGLVARQKVPDCVTGTRGVRRRYQGRPLTVAPAAPRLIDRGDLVAALDRAATRKVTIISAPAGSGKTSLLRAWADRPGQPRRLAVLQVQRDQQDAQQFWLALLDAVRQATGATAARNRRQRHPTSTRRRWPTGCCRSSPMLAAASRW